MDYCLNDILLLFLQCNIDLLQIHQSQFIIFVSHVQISNRSPNTKFFDQLLLLTLFFQILQKFRRQVLSFPTIVRVWSKTFNYSDFVFGGFMLFTLPSLLALVPWAQKVTYRLGCWPLNRLPPTDDNPILDLLIRQRNSGRILGWGRQAQLLQVGLVVPAPANLGRSFSPLNFHHRTMNVGKMRK